jgi:O-antigen ligase
VKLNVSTKQVSRATLHVFLVLTFFIYYQTKVIPGTLHAWVLVFGLIFTLPALLGRFRLTDGKLSLDYAVVAFLALHFILGYAANVSGATVSQLQAYVLALGCYVFVRENAPSLSITFLASLMKYFLLCNGLFVILQFITGGFYPASYFAAGDPPLLIPSGVSDGPTKNGMLTSFALSFWLARLLWASSRASYLDILTFIVGAVSLVVSASRAGIVSFCVVALIGCVLAVIGRKAFRVNARNCVILASIVLVPIIGILVAFDFAKLVELRDPNIDRYAADFLLYKLTASEDDSFDTRFRTVGLALKMILESPAQVLSVGFGLGSFEALNGGVNIHNSYVEVLFETGLYGVLAFLFLTAHVVRKALSRREVVEVLPVLFALMSVMVFMAFHDVLRGRIFWIPLAILASFAYAKTKRTRAVPVEFRTKLARPPKALARMVIS